MNKEQKRRAMVDSMPIGYKAAFFGVLLAVAAEIRRRDAERQNVVDATCQVLLADVEVQDA